MRRNPSDIRRGVIRIVILMLVAGVTVPFLNLLCRGQEQNKIQDAVNSLYVGSNREWMDHHFGPAAFLYEHGDFTERVYMLGPVAVRAFFSGSSDSCSAFTVTALADKAGGNYVIPSPNEHVTAGRTLGEFSYYEIEGTPAQVMGYVSNGIARSFYLEEYSYSSGDAHTYFFASLDYGTDWGKETFETALVLASDDPYIDEEIEQCQNKSPFLTLNRRREIRPNTYGMSDPSCSAYIRNLIAQYHGYAIPPLATVQGES